MLLELDSMDWFAFVLTSLASWRLSSMLIYEEGPYSLFLRMRRLLARSGMTKLATCHHCASVWVSALLVLLVYSISILDLLLIPATAGAASCLERALGGSIVEEES